MLQLRPCAVCGTGLFGKGYKLTRHEFDCYRDNPNKIPSSKVRLFLNYKNAMRKVEVHDAVKEKGVPSLDPEADGLLDNLRQRYGNSK